MNIFLIRHAEAIDYQTETVRSDEYRFLTPKGRLTSLKVSKQLKNEFIGLEKIFTSPLIRAVQTAEILASVIKFDKDVEAVKELAFGVSASRMISLIERNAGYNAIALVGHEPMMSMLFDSLTSSPFPDKFRKSGVCLVNYNVKNKSGKPVWYFNPKTLKKE